MWPCVWIKCISSLSCGFICWCFFLLLQWWWVKVAMSLCALVAYVVLPACIDYAYWLWWCYTNYFYLFKVVAPWFIYLFTNLLFIVFAFSVCLFFVFANKVELTKADLQGREGGSSPLLVWTERCFYVTFGAFLLDTVTPLRLEEKGSLVPLEVTYGLKKDTKMFFVDLRGLTVSISVNIPKSTVWFPEMVGDHSGKKQLCVQIQKIIKVVQGRRDNFTINS